MHNFLHLIRQKQPIVHVSDLEGKDIQFDEAYIVRLSTGDDLIEEINFIMNIDDEAYSKQYSLVGEIASQHIILAGFVQSAQTAHSVIDTTASHVQTSTSLEDQHDIAISAPCAGKIARYIEDYA